MILVGLLKDSILIVTESGIIKFLTLKLIILIYKELYLLREFEQKRFSSGSSNYLGWLRWGYNVCLLNMTKKEVVLLYIVPDR